MKIAMLTTTGDRCGIAAYTAALIDALRRQPDIEVEVIPIETGKQPTEHYIAQSALLNAPDIDLVHIQHEHSFWGGILPKRSAFWEMRYLIKKPVVITAHTTYSLAEMLRLKEERRPHKYLIKKLLTLNKRYRDSVDIAPFITGYCIIHTLEAAREIVRRGAAPETVAVIPAGVPATRPAPANGADFRARYDLEGRRILSIFGYIAFNKGYERTLELLSKLPEEVVLVIAGGVRTADMEPYHAQLQETIARSGLASRVRITGYLTEDEIAEALAATEIVLVPHTQATGSYSVTVPLSYGKPILASDLACFREIKERLDCIALFSDNSQSDYETQLKALLSNPQEQERLRNNAREYARRFSWDEIAKTTIATYEAALKVFGTRRKKNFIPLSSIEKRPRNSAPKS